MKPLNQKARAVLDKLIEAFENPECLIDTITRATLIPNNSPCIKWSPHTRLARSRPGFTGSCSNRSTCFLCLDYSY